MAPLLALLALGAETSRAAPELPPINFTVAFLGDQGLSSRDPDAEAVLRLIATEGADAVVHSGDFDYRNDPAAWDAQITSVLGENFPYFASVGNHDRSRFYASGGYQELLEARLSRLGISWQGDLGVQSSLRYAGLFFVLTAPDVFGAGDGFHDLYIRDTLAADDSIWRISSWHKNMRRMQTGGKSDETGWGVYEESRRGAAIIVTGHEHSYARTHLMSRFETQEVASTENTLVLRRDDPSTPEDEGRGFAVVSGMGGKSVRAQKRGGPWWASIYTRTQGASSGALFGVFHHEGHPRLAYFYFKDIAGNVPDQFFVESASGLGPECADGLDNDADGGIDFDPATIAGLDQGSDGLMGRGDPACESSDSPSESAECQDGIDNDLELGIDFDGGESIWAVAVDQADPECLGAPWWDAEALPEPELGVLSLVGLVVARALSQQRCRN
ncbi:MAG: metallophosphoesterase [Myxococcota bacterium]